MSGGCLRKAVLKDCPGKAVLEECAFLKERFAKAFGNKFMQYLLILYNCRVGAATLLVWYNSSFFILTWNSSAFATQQAWHQAEHFVSNQQAQYRPLDPLQLLWTSCAIARCGEPSWLCTIRSRAGTNSLDQNSFMENTTQWHSDIELFQHTPDSIYGYIYKYILY